MEYINLWKNKIPFFNEEFQTEENINCPSISPFIIDDNNKHSCIIIFPGGGYNHRAEQKGEKVAKWLNCIGINAFVLNYRVFPYKYPANFVDAKRAIKFVRYNCQKFNIFNNKIGVMGFSAGGHLACTVTQHYDKTEDYDINDDINSVSARPDICVLCYPVISFNKKIRHEGSALNFIDNVDSVADKFSCEKNVNSDMPPVFIWHTVEDKSVNVINSIELSKALKEKNIPFEMHIFPNGRHGLGLAEDTAGTSQWRALFENWIKEQKFT